MVRKAIYNMTGQQVQRTSPTFESSGARRRHSRLRLPPRKTTRYCSTDTKLILPKTQLLRLCINFWRDNSSNLWGLWIARGNKGLLSHNFTNSSEHPLQQTRVGLVEIAASSPLSRLTSAEQRPSTRPVRLRRTLQSCLSLQKRRCRKRNTPLTSNSTA